MAKKPQVAVEPRPDGRWAVRTDGMMRADSLHDRKNEAIRRGRELAESRQTELVIKVKNGQIADRDSYTRAPIEAKVTVGFRKAGSANTDIIQSKAIVFATALKKLANR